MTTTTDFREEVGFQAISMINFQTKSCLGEANVRWGGISINATQGATAGFTLDVSSPTAANCALVLQRLLTCLFDKQRI